MPKFCWFHLLKCDYFIVINRYCWLDKATHLIMLTWVLENKDFSHFIDKAIENQENNLQIMKIIVSFSCKYRVDNVIRTILLKMYLYE